MLAKTTSQNSFQLFSFIWLSSMLNHLEILDRIILNCSTTTQPQLFRGGVRRLFKIWVTTITKICGEWIAFQSCKSLYRYNIQFCKGFLPVFPQNSSFKVKWHWITYVWAKKRQVSFMSNKKNRQPSEAFFRWLFDGLSLYFASHCFVHLKRALTKTFHMKSRSTKIWFSLRFAFF